MYIYIYMCVGDPLARANERFIWRREGERERERSRRRCATVNGRLIGARAVISRIKRGRDPRIEYTHTDATFFERRF